MKLEKAGFKTMLVFAAPGNAGLAFHKQTDRKPFSIGACHRLKLSTYRYPMNNLLYSFCMNCS